MTSPDLIATNCDALSLTQGVFSVLSVIIFGLVLLRKVQIHDHVRLHDFWGKSHVIVLRILAA